MNEETVSMASQFNSGEFALSGAEQNVLDQLKVAKNGQTFRFTPLRQLVYLFVFRAQSRGISAYHILDMMKSYNPQAKPATVYRSLDFLLQNGLIAKIESKSKFVIIDVINSQETSIYIVCSICGAIHKFVDKALKDILNRITKESGHRIKNDYLEIEAICEQCQQHSR